MAQALIEKARLLPADLKALFFSDEPMFVAEEACLLYGLPVEKLAMVTLPLGAIFVGDMKLAEYPAVIAAKAGVDEGTACGIAYEINRRIFLKFPEPFKEAEALQRDWDRKKKPPVVSADEAKKKLSELEAWFFEKDPEEIEEERLIAATRVKLPLLAAIGKYPKLGEQPVTDDRIFLKSQPEPVRPNLMNWLKCYREELGVGYHEPVLRAKFLFQSQNGKNLSSDDRERVNLLLRSMEENVSLDIDTGKMEIVFPSFNVHDTRPAPPRAPSTSVFPAISKMPPTNLPVSPASAAPQAFSPARTDQGPAPVPVSPAGPRKPDGFPVPPPAPKRDPSADHRSTFEADRSAGSIVLDDAADAQTAGSGLRMAKGMHFTKLEAKDTPKTGAGAPEKLSFSSNHTLPTEKDDTGSFSIARSLGKPLPSGVGFAPKQEVAAPASPAASPKANPFHIHPRSANRDEQAVLAGIAGTGDVAGRVVNLRDEK